jgi:hypothetical protein
MQSRPLAIGQLSQANNCKRRGRISPASDHVNEGDGISYEHPLVEPQVSHFRQVPFRTIVKLPHSEQLSPS